jgi:hypothetical protein
MIGAASLADSGAQTPPPFNVDLWNFCSNLNNYPPKQGSWVSAYLAGHANASKLKGAAALGYPAPALAHAGNGANDGFHLVGLGQSGHPPIDGEQYDCFYNGLELDHGGQRALPPATATFMAFGFMPVTATAYLTQVGKQPITALLAKDIGPCGSLLNGSCTAQGDTAGPYSVVSRAEMSLRIADVKVNGTPLDVGNNCHTVVPLSSPGNPIGASGLVLSGGSFPGEPAPPATNALLSGSFDGFATIPPFTGCVTPDGDNLNALITSSVSGSGNYVKVTTGNLCINDQKIPGGDGGGTCSPGDSSSLQPLPHFTPYWTVKHGGAYTATATAPVSLDWNPNAEGRLLQYVMSCSSASFAGRFDDTTGPPRGNLGEVTSLRFHCTGTKDGSTWSITQQGTASFHGSFYCPDQATCAPSGHGSVPTPATLGSIDDLTLVLNGTNVNYRGSSAPTCHVVLSAVPGLDAVYFKQSGRSMLAIGGFEHLGSVIGQSGLEITSSTDNAGNLCPALNTVTTLGQSDDPRLTPVTFAADGITPTAGNFVLSPGGTVISQPTP